MEEGVEMADGTDSNRVLSLYNKQEVIHACQGNKGFR